VNQLDFLPLTMRVPKATGVRGGGDRTGKIYTGVSGAVSATAGSGEILKTNLVDFERLVSEHWV